MRIKSRRLGWSAAVLAGIVALAGPAFAVGHGGGGGGGGGHFAGGGHAGGGHVASGHAAGGAHYAGGAVAGGFRGGPAGAHYAGAARGYGGASVGAAHYAVGGRAAYGYAGRGYARGYSTGAYWGGGYWHGGYWPRAYYGLGFSWFLPVLPLAYATYWYDGNPYYYANDVYYTWNPDYNGYTATDPPPAADAYDGGSGSAAAAADGNAPAPGAPVQPVAQGSDQIFMYPKNGQNPAQQSADKEACQQWAASQAAAQNPSEYRRAMLACVEGRGYSAN